MEIGIVKQVDIQEEMQGAYLDYAMSVIVARALPDVRDGLKPVHRRILYAMHDMGLTFEKPYKKSARIVGEVLGKYHPHGDVAVYDAMVRMAQDFSLRYTLVDGQGNFGSIDGDNPAAMRYTEARLRDLAAQMLSDIDKDTIDFVPNFDETLQEPSVLPAALPNLLVNGASGIAVGMATNIPPHNLVEVCDALAYLIDRYDKVDEITVEELMRFIKGPDFPTGGMIYRYESDSRTDGDDVIARAYASGRGRFRVQARIHIEEMSRSRNRIVVTELPYQVNKTRLIERIAELARDEKIEGITDLRDESDRSGMRIVIETTRTVDPKKVLADLYKYTPMQQTFGMSMLALVNGEPRHLGLRRVLQLHVEHRREIIRRRSEYELRQAKERAHILEGLLRALDILDEVIQAIRRSRTTATARANLIREFKFTEAQAQAILDMPLKRLAALERRRLQDEYEELLTRITYLEDLLAHPKKILDVIKEELADLREQYGDARRTRIIEAGVTQQSLTVRDMIADEPVLLALGPNGMVLRESMADRRRGKLPSKVDGQAPMTIAAGSTHDEVFFFAADGRMGRLAVHRLPEAGDVHPADRGVFNRNDRLVTVLVLGRLLDEEDNGRYLVLATREGRVKRIALRDAWNAIGVTTAMKVEDGDELIGAEVSDGSAEIILVTKLGQAIRFQESEVRPMGLPAAGVWGMKLSRGDEVVALCITRPDGELVIATTAGYFKRTALRHYSEQRRHGSGLSAIRLGQRSGAVADARIALPGDEFFSASRTGTLRRLDLQDIPAAGRTATGRLIIQPAKNDIIVDLLHLPTTRTRSTPATASGSKTPPENRPQPRRQQPTGSGESKKKDETASPRSIRSRGRRSRSRSSTADGAGPDSSKPAAASPTRSSGGARATPKPSTSRRSKAPAGSSGKAPARKSSPDKEPKDAAPTAKGAEKASQKTKPQASQLSLLDKLRSVQKP